MVHFHINQTKNNLFCHEKVELQYNKIQFLRTFSLVTTAVNVYCYQKTTISNCM